MFLLLHTPVFPQIVSLSLFCKHVNVMCIFKSFILLPMCSEVPFFKIQFCFSILEGFLQLTSEFRLLAHILYLRVRQQKLKLVNWWPGLTEGGSGCTLLLDSQRNNETEQGPMISSLHVLCLPFVYGKL